MKRLIPIVLILFGTVPVFAQNGIITEMNGTVELRPADQTDFIPAKMGDTIARNTIVSTGFKSMALITVGSSVITVRPLTRLSLAEISEADGTETLSVNLQIGRVRADVKPPSGKKTNMVIQSPMATASVRGTSFEFDTESLTVLEGTVAFQGSNGATMLVGAGSTSQLTETGKAVDPLETYTAALAPPPVAGSDSGFRSSSTGNTGVTAEVPPASEQGTIGIIFELQ